MIPINQTVRIVSKPNYPGLLEVSLNGERVRNLLDVQVQFGTPGTIPQVTLVVLADNVEIETPAKVEVIDSPR